MVSDTDESRLGAMSLSDSEEDDGEDEWQNWEDDDDSDGSPVKSLFDDSTFPCIVSAIHYDGQTYNFDLRQYSALVHSTLSFFLGSASVRCQYTNRGLLVPPTIAECQTLVHRVLVRLWRH